MSFDEFLTSNPLSLNTGSVFRSLVAATVGGGHRAMVFHVGALIRLNEVALLHEVKRISSVSGGSITAAVLGTSWKDLQFTDDVAVNFDVVVERVRQMADTTVDAGAIIGGILLPDSISDRVSKAYDK
jgi:NTE family protein